MGIVWPLVRSEICAVVGTVLMNVNREEKARLAAYDGSKQTLVHTSQCLHRMKGILSTRPGSPLPLAHKPIVLALEMRERESDRTLSSS